MMQQVGEQVSGPRLYVIGVLDILGQSRRLRECVNFPPVTEADAQRVERNLRETVGTVDRFRQLFQLQFETRQQTFDEDLLEIPEPERATLRAALAPTLVSWGMSDTYCVAVPLQPGSGHIGAMATFASVYRLLQATAVTWLVSLADGVPFRGGVELGMAAQMRENDVYGQALIHAYHLESEVAQWSRIVVGETLVVALEGVRQNRDPRFQGAAMFADRCRSMLRRGIDGNTEIDLLDGVWSNAGHRQAFREVFGRAHDYVREQLREHQAAENTTLISRYQTLLAYFNDRATAWHR